MDCFLLFISIFCFFLFFQEKIEAINQALVNEYEVRRKMLLKRLDVTVQSFGWSDRAKVGLVCKHSEHLVKNTFYSNKVVFN